MKKLKVGVMILGCAVLAIAGNAATNDVSGLLQKGLFEEEANRNLEAAIMAYQGVIAQTDKDRKFGATAIFRLGECYRKLGKTNEANEQYARIVREFPEQTELVKLSQQHGGASTVIGAGNTQQETIGKSGWELASVMQAEVLSRQLAALKDLPADKRRILVQQQYGNPVIDSLMQKLADAEQQLAVEKQGKSDLHPDVIRGNQAIEKLQKQIDQQVDGVILGLELKVKAAQETAKIIDARSKQEAAAMKSGGNATTAKPTIMTSGSAEDEDREIRRIQAMIKNSPDLINATDNSNWTPLERAASLGQLSVAKFLLENKASLQVGRGRKTPLHLAADNGHKAMVELLLNSGAEVNIRDSSEQTPLHLAASKGFLSVAEVLVTHGADVNARNSSKKTPLHEAVAKGKTSVADLLVQHKADVNAKAENGETVLMDAVLARQPQLVEMLLKSGAAVDARRDWTANDSVKEWAALHFAVRENQIEVVKLLLERGANPNVKVFYSPQPGRGSPKGDFSPLHIAVYQLQKDIAELLLKHKAEVDSRDDNQKTPLRWAVEQGSKELVELLLANKADVNSKDREGYTPLFYAVGSNNKEMTGLLIRNGADMNVRDRNGRALLYYVLEPNTYDIAKLLIESGADVNIPDSVGNKPLDWVRNSSGDFAWKEKMTKLLRDKGAVSTTELSTIRATRAGLDSPVEFFRKDKEGLNRYTLYELLSKIYGTTDTKFPFPNLNKVSIKRRIAGQDKTENIEVKLKDDLDSGDCAKDMWLEWGDVVDIPEADHNINASWQGLPARWVETLEKCLARKVAIVVKGQTNEVLLEMSMEGLREAQMARRIQSQLTQSASKATSGVAPSTVTEPKITTVSGFRLNKVVRDAGVLLASSDLSRVKVSRLDPVTKQVQEKVFDLSQASQGGMPGGVPGVYYPSAMPLRQPVPGATSASVPLAEPYNLETDLWLRDGDVIEIPEKP